MASWLRLSLLVFALLHAVLLLPNLVHCGDEEDSLLQGINSYRQSLNLPDLVKNDKAGCLANEVADQLEDQPCISTPGPMAIAPGSRTQISNYHDLLDKCSIDEKTTADGVILPVCVPKLVPTLVLTNYTHSQYSKYLNNSKYTGAGIGKEDDWMVVVLTTNTPTGTFAGAAALSSRIWANQCLVVLLVGVFLSLLN
ncbi:putative GPI-anchored protein [Actinidia chinensis var. chinensis]|uniref:Putative GPI-anchored protein n=1 Tax=Actinidia chinensis var. chinensis TaxID=1590841 RepID=A0A2R6RBI5_ACTCC|nr:putative GPI-anchored protein [Actinidia chinensis var. chinensis]